MSWFDSVRRPNQERQYGRFVRLAEEGGGKWETVQMSLPPSVEARPYNRAQGAWVEPSWRIVAPCKPNVIENGEVAVDSTHAQK